MYVIPYVSTSGTSGTASTPALTGNIDNFKLVDDGALKLTIDGVAVQLSNLNFTGITTVDDIIEVILAKTPDCFITQPTTNVIKFTSKSIGTTSTKTESAHGKLRAESRCILLMKSFRNL